MHTPSNTGDRSDDNALTLTCGSCGHRRVLSSETLPDSCEQCGALFSAYCPLNPADTNQISNDAADKQMPGSAIEGPARSEMSSTTVQSTLRIIYTGTRVTVDPTQITEDMSVPNREYDFPGRDAVTLIDAALAAKALIVPDGITVSCRGEDDEDGGGFTIEVHPTDDSRIAITLGWENAAHLARCNDDHREDDHPGVVENALRFVAARINSMLQHASEGNQPSSRF